MLIRKNTPVTPMRQECQNSLDLELYSSSRLGSTWKRCYGGPKMFSKKVLNHSSFRISLPSASLSLHPLWHHFLKKKRKIMRIASDVVLPIRNTIDVKLQLIFQGPKDRTPLPYFTTSQLSLKWPKFHGKLHWSRGTFLPCFNPVLINSIYIWNTFENR